MKPALFFSHSSLDTERCRPLVQALQAGGALEVAFDANDLAPGLPWRSQLNDWLNKCHGGVVFITESVLGKHDWVLLEASLMGFRAEREPNHFRLFVVLDEGLDQDPRYQAVFSALPLGTLQRLTVAKAATWADEVQRLADRIRAQMAEVPAFADDLHARWAELVYDDLGAMLERLAVQRAFAEAFEARAGTALRVLSGPREAMRLLAAHQLARAEFGALHSIAGLFARLVSVCPLPPRQLLFEHLKSWCVPLAQAQALGDALARARQGHRGSRRSGNVVLVPVDARPADLAELQAHRRFTPFGHYRLLAIGQADSEVDALHTLLGELRRRLKAPDAGLRAVVRRLARLQTPLLVHAHVGLDASHLQRVMRLFWPCTFVLTAGPAQAPAIAQALGLAPVAWPVGQPGPAAALALNDEARSTLSDDPEEMLT